MDNELVTLLRAADAAASVAHDFIYGRNGVTQQEASDAIWTIHNALRPLFGDDPEPSGDPTEGALEGLAATRNKYTEVLFELAYRRRQRRRNGVTIKGPRS